MPPSDLPLNQKSNYHTRTCFFCLKWVWLNAVLVMADTLYRVCLIAVGGLSSSCTFAELISADGYMERQVTEACISALHWQPGSRPDGLTSQYSCAIYSQLTSHLNCHKITCNVLCLTLRRNIKREDTYQARDRCWQPVDLLDDARLDLVDQTASKKKERRER